MKEAGQRPVQVPLPFYREGWQGNYSLPCSRGLLAVSGCLPRSPPELCSLVHTRWEYFLWGQHVMKHLLYQAKLEEESTLIFLRTLKLLT